MHMSAGVHKDQKGAPDPQMRKPQAVVSHIAWVLGTELQFSGRTA